LAVAKRDENGNEILIKYMNMDPTNPIFTCSMNICFSNTRFTS
jgi:hypothetical protein